MCPTSRPCSRSSRPARSTSTTSRAFRRCSISGPRRFPARRSCLNPNPFVEFIYFNCGKPQFQDKRVRKALYMAIDRKGWIDAVYYGVPVPTLSYLPPNHWAYNKALVDPGYDPHEGGRAPGRGGLEGRCRRCAREGRGAPRLHHVDHRRQQVARAGATAGSAEPEEDQRRDDDQEHAGVRRVGRLHGAEPVRHA